MKDESVVLLDENGLRTDGRRLDQLRPIKITAGVSHRADGSAYLEWGGNKVMAAVYGPRETHPRHKQETDRARVAFRYNMAPFSVSDRKRPGPDRRSWEISKVASEAFSNVVFLNEFPRSTIDVVVEVLQADAGTRCAAITCASVALADAGIPMKDMLVSCAAGKINGRIALDMHNIEDNKGEGDLPMAIVPSTGEVVLLQMDGELTPAEMNEAIEFIYGAVGTISAIQAKALKDKYAVSKDEAEEIDRSAPGIGAAAAPAQGPAAVPQQPPAPVAGAAAGAPAAAPPAEPAGQEPPASRQPPWLAGQAAAPAPAAAPPVTQAPQSPPEAAGAPVQPAQSPGPAQPQAPAPAPGYDSQPQGAPQQPAPPQPAPQPQYPPQQQQPAPPQPAPAPPAPFGQEPPAPGGAPYPQQQPAPQPQQTFLQAAQEGSAPSAPDTPPAPFGGPRKDPRYGGGQ